MASLTEDEYNQLDITTLKAVNKPDQRLVTIEVFHQLHCLVSGNRLPAFSEYMDTNSVHRTIFDDEFMRNLANISKSNRIGRGKRTYV